MSKRCGGQNDSATHTAAARIPVLWGVLALIAILSANRASAQDQTGSTPTAASRTASEDVYTDAQIQRGKSLYADNCMQCHGGGLAGLEGAPPLVGRLFLNRWGGRPVSALHSFIGNEMPPGNPGLLGASSEADIVAYILSKNDFPPGSSPLPADPAGLGVISLK